MLNELSLDPARVARLTAGAVVVRVEMALLQVKGSGALQCLQGLLTNDLLKPGDGTLTWGALLTPKGMIESDLWCLRTADTVTLVVPRTGVAQVAAVFKRSIPPRLAVMTDRTAEWSSLFLIGDGTGNILAASRLLKGPVAAGHVITTDAGILVARPGTRAPFDHLIIGPTAEVAAAEAKLIAAGGTSGSHEDAEASRVLAGWPALGAEIDDKTLPQEVRFDDLGGVSYTKGCYLGQETVARIHFRGHPNRELRGLEWEDTAPLDGGGITGAGRDAGTIRSTLITGGRRVGLAPIRREVQTGEMVIAGGRPARVVALPFRDLQGA